MQYEDSYTKHDGKCSKGDTSCNWVGKSKKVTKSPKGPMCTQSTQCLAKSTKSASVNSTLASYGSSIAVNAYFATNAANSMALAENGVNYGVASWNAFGLAGHYYTPSSVNTAVANSFTGLSALGVSAVTSLISNGISYSPFGEYSDQGYGQEFAVSTAVDTVLGFTVGAASALVVGAVLGASAAPLAVVAGTALLATGAMMALDYWDVPDMAKQGWNDILN